MLKQLTLWIWAGFFLRLANSINNGFFGPSIGADADAFWFHMAAVDTSRDLLFEEFVTGHIYSYLLGYFYYFTTDSLFLGSALSVLGWLLSAFILVRIMQILSFDTSSQKTAMLVYVFLPSSVMYTSITLREPFELLFVNLAIYSALKIYCHKSAIHWLILGVAVTCMGALHGALLASAIFILVGTLFLLTYRNRKGISLVKFLFVAPLIGLSLYYGTLLFLNISYELEDGLVTAVVDYQQAVIEYEGRAIYRTEVSINGAGDLLLSMPVFLLQYLFEPMPWRMSSLLDVVALLENVLRAWLIWNVLKYFRVISNKNPKIIEHKLFGHGRLIFFIFLSFLVMESIWSTGTSNWGNSLRHHVPSLGMLLVTGFAYQNVSILRSKRSRQYA